MAVKSKEEKAWITQGAQLTTARKNTATVLNGLLRACSTLELAYAQEVLKDLKACADKQKAVYERLEKTVDAYVKLILTPPANIPQKKNSALTMTAPKGAPSALAHDDTAFPTALTDDMINASTRASGGSTGARFLTVDGRRYVMKRPSSVTGEGNVSDECLRNEAAGDRMYRAAGILVPDCKVYEVDGKPVKVAEMIEGAKSIGEYFRTATDGQKKAVKEKLLRGFLVDAALGNWDVVGMSGDNILIDANGDPWRIDNGSVMGYRAQGTPKDAASWKDSQFPDEWRSLVDSSNNKKFFGDFTASEIFSQEIDWDGVLAEAPASDRPVLERRVKEIKEMQTRCSSLMRAGVVEKEVNAELNTSYDLCKAGLREAVPKVTVNGGSPNFGSFRPGNSSSAQQSPSMSPDDAKMVAAVDAITKAAKNVNFHATSATGANASKDGKPNMTTVAAGIAAGKVLAALKKKGVDTSPWDKIVAELKKVKASGQDALVSNVPAYTTKKAASPANPSQYGSITEWKADFIMRGGDLNAAPDWKKYEFIHRCAKSQSGNSWTGHDYTSWNDEDHPYTCIRKIIEFELMGKDPDPDSGGKNNEAYGFTPEQKDAYRKAWEYYRDPANKDEMDRARKAVSLDRAFTALEFENAGLPYYDPGTQTILLARTEKSDVISLARDENGMSLNAGDFGVLPSRGNGESCSMFKTVVVEGNHLTIQRVPISAIGDSYLTHKLEQNGSYSQKFLGDGENEAHVDLSESLECFYAGKVSRGQDLKPYYEAFLAAESKKMQKRP